MKILIEHWQAFASATIFLALIGLLITEWLHFMIAAILAALLTVVLNIMTLGEAMSYIGKSHSTLGLFFGVMVIVRAFEPTKIFEYLAAKMVIWARGQGKFLLLGIVGLTTPVCAFLPNATTVMLLAPLIPPIAQDVGVDFVPLLILMVFVANSSGLLTLVGDPVTFLVGDAINISFTDYLVRLSLAGVVAIFSVVLMLPILFPRLWRKKLENVDHLKVPTVNHPQMLAIGSVIITFVLVFFVVGDSLPIPVSPATVALLGAVLSLMVAHHSKIDSVSNILRDVDWSTLIFFMSIFVLIGSLEKTGVFSQILSVLTMILGKNIAWGSVLLLWITGLVSSLVPNIPLVVGMLPLLKGYVVNVGLAPPQVLAPNFAGEFPANVLPLFYAMMLGATLGGNGTIVGASANIVAAGIAEQHDRRISFKTFLRYGIPVMLVQLSVASVYMIVRFFLWL